jgi:hypothetical protein
MTLLFWEIENWLQQLNFGHTGYYRGFQCRVFSAKGCFKLLARTESVMLPF